jgi:LL-diaminopimelate aminotransferase
MASRIISLGIGDTTQPIPEHILSGLVNSASKLGTKEGYSGYGAEQGMAELRKKIADKLYGGIIKDSEVFVSDGAKCDIMRVQQVFGPGVITAVQDPSYPVYVDTSVMMGQTGNINPDTKQFDRIVYMPCTDENNFFPDIDNLPRADIVYFCSPNNPTGAAATKEQLEKLVKVCKERGSILVFDAAYAPFIRSEGVPKSIFEIEGAREVAMECNSFSKYAGFTGVRLGWTVVPDELTFADGSKVRDDFNRIMTTAFNGASNIVQGGGLACLDDEGLAEIDTLIDYYLENAKLLKEAMESIGYAVYGGTDAPYVFVKLPEGKNSWDTFSEILEKAQVVTIPGAGFGPGGEGYLRFSAFAPRETVIEACSRLKETLG